MKISKAKELKAKMESDIADILINFETETGLQPGIVFHERTTYTNIHEVEEVSYRVNIPVHL